MCVYSFPFQNSASLWSLLRQEIETRSRRRQLEPKIKDHDRGLESDLRPHHLLLGDEGLEQPSHKMLVSGSSPTSSSPPNLVKS